MKGVIAAVVIAAVVMAAVATAHAGDRGKAEQYFRAGEQAFRKQSFAAAAENFELAFTELPLPEIAFSAAQAYRRQYYVDAAPAHVKRAVELYRIYLDKVKTGGRVGDASDGLAEMLHELDRLTARGAKLDAKAITATRIAVSIVSDSGKTAVTEISALPSTDDTPTAAATIDGKRVELYAPIDVGAGEHAIEVTAAGYATYAVKRRVIDGQTEIVEARLQPLPAHLVIATETGAEITIDGKPLHGTRDDLPAGTHTIAVTRRGREPVLRQLQLVRGETRELAVPLQRTTQRKTVPWLFGGAAIVGSVALATGALAVWEDSKLSGLETKRETVGITTEQLGELRRDTRHRDELSAAAWISLGAAVVAGATAAGLYYFDTPVPRETSVAPVVGPGTAGISVVGKF